MGWSKRSSGRRYNSQSGHGVLIVQSSKKIVDSVLYQKSCHICTNGAGKDIALRSYNCMIDWTESSKATECDGIVHLCGEAPTRIFSIFKLVKNDDTNMRAQLMYKKEGTKG